MRIWLDPQKLAVRNLTSDDIVTAISQQNVQVAAGQIGQPPVPEGQIFQYTMTTLGRLSDAVQFAADGRRHRPAGPASSTSATWPNIELGAMTYDQTCKLDGQPSVALSVYQLPGSNALQVEEAIKSKMEDLKKRFPPDLDYKIVYDTTPFINESIGEVFNTPAATPSSWWRSSCCCSCRTGARPSFRWSPCPSPSSGRLR